MDNTEKARELINKHLYLHGGDELGISNGDVYSAVLDAVIEALSIANIELKTKIMTPAELVKEILKITNESPYGWLDMDSVEAGEISKLLKKEYLIKHYQAEQLTLPTISDTLILTPKDAEVFFNEIMSPKDANEALKKAMLKFITR